MPELFQTEQIDDVLHVRAADVVDTMNIGEMIDALEVLVRRDSPRKLLLNLRPVVVLQSSALGRLNVLRNLLAETQGTLRLCMLHPQIRDVLRVTKLDRVLPCYATEAEALSNWDASTVESPTEIPNRVRRPPTSSPAVPPHAATGRAQPCGRTWYMFVRGTESGPFTRGGLQQFARAGILNGDDLVRDGDRDWIAAQLVPGLFKDENFVRRAPQAESGLSLPVETAHRPV